MNISKHGSKEQMGSSAAMDGFRAGREVRMMG